MKLRDEESLGWDNVHLLADKPSLVRSRRTIDPELWRLIIAPMRSVQNLDLVAKATQLGLSIVINRSNTLDEQYKLLEQAKWSRSTNGSKSKIWLAVGLKDWEDRLNRNADLLKGSDIGVCLDTANGYSIYVFDTLAKLKEHKLVNPYSLMCGNVNTAEGFSALKKFCSLIRCNIGTSKVCETSTRTGFGRGSFTLVTSVYNQLSYGGGIICDGGLTNPGRISKAFLAGSEYCMLGSYISKASELGSTPRYFWGEASKRSKIAQDIENDFIEGREEIVQDFMPLQSIVEEISNGVTSAVSYSGYGSLSSAIGNGTFEVIK